MKHFTTFGLLALAGIGTIAAFSSCGRPPPTAASAHTEAPGEHGDHDEHGAEETHVSFVEGKGLLLDVETRTAIGVQSASVEMKAVDFDEKTQAQVFRLANEAAFPANGYESGVAYASALISSESLPYPLSTEFTITTSPPATARLARIDRQTENPLGLIELVYALPDPEYRWKLGDTVILRRAPGPNPAPALIVPKSAVLSTSTGDFIYIVNEKHFLRTPVKVGRSNSAWAEILAGAKAGEQVAVQPVETLYLAELRLTKGGGHSH